MRSLLRRAGIDVVAYEPRNYPHLRRPLLLRELGIRLVIDGGASDGSWAARLRQEGYSHRILSIEPYSASFAELERRAAGDDGWECRRVALAAAAGSGELHVAGNRQSSSLMPILPLQSELAPGTGEIGVEPVELARLDDLVAESAGPIYLKLDLQGGELAALRGAERTLEDAQAVEVELSTVPLYEGQPLLPEVLEFLAASGYRIIGLETAFRNRETGDLIQTNALLRRA
jgi:FkbM family methyltransferase